jgi:septal ring factor EnvC (AmiA/AmiB activator)
MTQEQYPISEYIKLRTIKISKILVNTNRPNYNTSTTEIMADRKKTKHQLELQKLEREMISLRHSYELARTQTQQAEQQISALKVVVASYECEIKDAEMTIIKMQAKNNRLLNRNKYLTKLLKNSNEFDV